MATGGVRSVTALRATRMGYPSHGRAGRPAGGPRKIAKNRENPKKLRGPADLRGTCSKVLAVLSVSCLASRDGLDNGRRMFDGCLGDVLMI